MLLLLVLVGSPVLVVAGVLLVSSGILAFGGPIPHPPASTLTFEEQTVNKHGNIGCWTEKRPYLPDDETCITWSTGKPRGEIGVPAGSSVVFTYGGENPPVEVEARAYEHDQASGGRNPRPEGKPQYVPPRGYTKSTELPVGPVANSTEIAADLGHGEYLMVVLVTADDPTAKGDAAYSFGVAVE